jgi:molecular chaperone GrpE
MQRRQADFENFKRHTRKQQDEFKKYALRDIALDIITINDDLIRAIESSVEITDNSESSLRMFSEGVQMISNRIEGALEKYGVVQIDSEGAVFDPNFHEAVEIETVDGIDQDMVAKVYLKGFRIDEMVIRSSKVKVAKPARAQKNETLQGAPLNGEQTNGNSGAEGATPT